jgi:hypothetical protein
MPQYLWISSVRSAVGSRNGEKQETLRKYPWINSHLLIGKKPGEAVHVDTLWHLYWQLQLDCRQLLLYPAVHFTTDVRASLLVFFFRCFRANADVVPKFQIAAAASRAVIQI